MVYSSVVICAEILGNPILFRIKINEHYLVTISFSFYYEKYVFVITDFFSEHERKIIKSFHEHCERDKIIFGSSLNNFSSFLNIQQKIAVIEQICHDIIFMINEICCLFGKNEIPSIYLYLDKSNMISKYQQYIIEVTCRCLIQSDFFIPSIHWLLVDFF